MPGISSSGRQERCGLTTRGPCRDRDRLDERACELDPCLGLAFIERRAQGTRITHGGGRPTRHARAITA